MHYACRCPFILLLCPAPLDLAPTLGGAVRGPVRRAQRLRAWLRRLPRLHRHLHRPTPRRRARQLGAGRGGQPSAIPTVRGGAAVAVGPLVWSHGPMHQSACYFIGFSW